VSQMGELTLMAVHAHPDDEAISTPGVLARYSLEGVRTVLVTCTDGALGFGPGRSNPGEPAHDPVSLAVLRSAELESSCAHLGVRHLEVLGYHDSGMAGWESNRDPAAFCNAPIDEVADRLASLIERYRPHVLVTYDADGGYGHPDHIRTHRVTMAALERTEVVSKVYLIARTEEFRRRMQAARGALTSGADAVSAAITRFERRSNHDEGGHFNGEGPPSCCARRPREPALGYSLAQYAGRCLQCALRRGDFRSLFRLHRVAGARGRHVCRPPRLNRSGTITSINEGIPVAGTSVVTSHVTMTMRIED